MPRQLLAFARKQIVKPKVFFLDDHVLNLENMLQRVLGEKVELSIFTAKDRWSVKVGYAEEQIVHEGIVDENVAFLAKPFTPAALSEKVRDVLDHR